MAPKKKIGQIGDCGKNRMHFSTYDGKEIPEKASILHNKLELLGICDHKIFEKNQISIPLHEQNLINIAKLHENNAGTDHEESINRALSDWMFQTMKHKLVSLSTHEENGKKWYYLKPIG